MRFYKLLLMVLLSFLATACNNDSNVIIPPTPGVPTITSVTPNTVSRGQELTLSIRGTNFTGVSAVNLGPGITVIAFRTISTTQVDVDASSIKNAAPGAREVTVTTAAGVARGPSAITVSSNSAPEVSFTMDPPPGNLSTKVDISFDASATVDPNGGSLTFRWDFGDGSNANGQKTSHRYNSTGSFTITLTVEDGAGAANSETALAQVSANAAPVPVIKITPNKGTENDEFEFDGSGSFDPDGRVVQYVWDFHDGKPKVTGKIVKRKFSQGKYDVSLLVTDNRGNSDFTSEELTVEKATEIVCTDPLPNSRGLLYGTVIGVESGHNMIVKMDNPRANCSNSYYYCGDVRDAEVDLGFFGIIHKMTDLGDGTLRIFNDCPFRWPPTIGQRVFLFYKSCANNFCP